MIASGPSQLSLAVANANRERAYSDNLLAKAGHLALASVVDFGAAVYNSLDFFDVLEDAETDAVLDGLGATSTAEFYQDNTELVQGVSFFGGIFIPGGLAVKGSQLLRAGLKGSHVLNPRKVQAQARLASRMVREGKRGTREYRDLKMSTYRNAIAQGVVDNAAAEVAILGALNAHPLMEDYMEELPSNFITSLAFGSAISGAVDLVSTRNLLAHTTGKTLAEAHQPVLDAIQQSPLVTPEGTDFKVLRETQKELDRIIGNGDYSTETRSFAMAVRRSTEVDARKAAEAVVKNTGVSADDAEFLRHAESILERAESLGVERLKFYNDTGATKRDGPLQRLSSLIRRTEDQPTSAEGVWSPQFEMYVTPTQASRIASAVDQGETAATLAKAGDRFARSKQHRVPQDIGENFAFAAASDVDRDFLVKLAGYDKLTLREVGQARIHRDDIASIQALSSRLSKEQRSIDDLLEQADDLVRQADEPNLQPAKKDKLLKESEEITNRATKRQEQLDSIDVQVVSSNISERALKDMGIGASHVSEVRRVLEPVTSIIDDVSGDLAGVLQRWFRGEPAVDQGIRTAISDLLRTGQTDSPQVRELLQSDHATKVRAALNQVADNEGNVHLVPRPTRALGEGYEVQTFSMANQGSRRTKALSVDNIIGVYKDDAGNANILAIDTTADAVRSNLGRMRLTEDGLVRTDNLSITSGNAMSFAEEATSEWVIAQSRTSLDEGLGIEELARRSNLDSDSIKRILGMPDAEALAEAGQTGFRYSDAARLTDYTANTQRMLRAEDSGNLDNYYDYLKMLEAGTDRKMLDEWAQDTTLDLMSTSQSRLVNELMRQYNAASPSGMNTFRAQIAMLKRSLGLINDELAGGRILQSADSYARRTGDAGRIINFMGDKFTAAYNETLNNYISPMNATLSKIAADDAQIVTLNTAIQVHRSISEGQIRFADGTFYVRKAGEQVEKEVMWQGQVFKVPSSMPEVRAFLEQSGRVGRELQQMRITKQKITGGQPPTDRGFWIPNFDARSTNVVFMRLPDGDQRIITGATPEDLATKQQALKEYHGGQIEFITPQQREDYRYLEGLAQQGDLRAADFSKTRAGRLANELPSTTLDEARSVIHSLADQLFTNAKNSHALVFDDAVQQLSQMKRYAQQATEGQAQSRIRKALGDPVVAADTMLESLLGSRGQLSRYVWWDKTNSAFESILTGTLNKWNRLAESVDRRTGKASERLAKLRTDLEEAGIPYPYAAFEDDQAFELFHTEARTSEARRVVAAGNALAATSALRFLEIAQPLVNAMSLPIMTYSAVAHKYDSKFLGFKKQANARFPMKYMMDGVRSMHDETYRPLFQQAEEQGYFNSIVSEATDAIKLTRLREKGALPAAEAALDKVDTFLGGATVAASDYSEALVRKVSFGTGVQLAKELYGMREGIDDAALLIFARNFMDRSIGNYSASQRPVLFHGTAGAAIGLFQTYMVTFAQNMYRHIEDRDFKALAGVMLTQAGIFGVGSLPGYDLVSKYIGENYSDNHTDLTTGLYRAVSDPTASAILYGLPSNLGGLAGLPGGGPNFSSRGAIDPRVPILGGEPPAGVAVALDSIQAAFNVGSRVAGALANDAESTPTAFLEAVSMQSVSRPLARLAELGTGNSVTRAGHTVQTPEEVYTPMGIMARLMSVRPTDEVRLREAVHLNTYYGSKDRDNRQQAMLEIRTAIREGTINRGLLDRVALEYMDNGGTGQGFRSALNQAMQSESTNLNTSLLQELRPDSPLINMLMDI